MHLCTGICIFSLQWILTHQLDNVALRGIATQSSLFSTYGAFFAIDGSRASNFVSSSCAHTNGQYNAWWRVDLLAVYDISNVIITNRGDAVPTRINGAEIHIGNSLINNGNNNPRCVVISTIPAGASVSYNCNMRGRYVNIIIPNIFQYLTLCEVEVYGTPENVALKGIATQSSLFQNYYAYLAIDGNRASSLYSYSCTHTDGQINSWWRVDLLAKYDISNVIITNRGDAVTTRINGAEIHIGSSLVNNGNDNPRCVVISTIPAGASVNYTCNMRGHYVNIIVPNIFQYLTLCEVEVYGTPANVALGGIATQSSLYTNNFYPNFAIDGKRTSIMGSGSCTHTSTQNNPWWRVDLLVVYDISNIIITNRGDCCAERINGAEIHIGNSLLNNGNNNPRCVVIPSMPAGASVNYTCNMIGRYVNVIIPYVSKVLSLCEVEVYGVQVPVIRRAFLRVKLNSSEDLINPTIKDKVLQEVRACENVHSVVGFSVMCGPVQAFPPLRLLLRPWTLLGGESNVVVPDSSEGDVTSQSSSKGGAAPQSLAASTIADPDVEFQTATVGAVMPQSPAQGDALLSSLVVAVAPRSPAEG
ncbi:hypothetical protein HF521_015224 [Silurus meridionalis]|uniref:Fucolectin tachylectin-4 pentraxin-1 domain-containing protein n=1 Tax=Silurus meridionalis TaxID=175797 RepID=A0A8T0A8L9_SILME|nr:hypothetical protein HF521_015224 [Silurus meridionalis]